MSFAPDLTKSTNPDLELLVDIHRYKRPKGTSVEQVFVETFLMPLGVRQDLYGNLHKIVQPAGSGEDYRPTVLWSSHTDTVHLNEGFQRIVLDANGMMSVHKREDTNCLGADDGAGVWLMMEMIRAGIEGHYIFHYGEEKGCEGSTKLADKAPEIFKDIKIAVAFDRKNNFDVVTKMGGQTVCSDDFADSLIKQLPVGYRKEPGGMRTDVALYKKLIPECTNISVGYTDPHMKTERLDTTHLIDLRNHLLKIDVSKLVVKRDPKAVEPVQTRGGHHNSHYNYGGGSTYYKEARPRTFMDLFKECPELCGEMMKEAGVDFEIFLSMALKQQKKKARTFSAVYKELIPYYDFKDPLADKPEPAKPVAETPVVKAPAKTNPPPPSNVVPMAQQTPTVAKPVNEGTD
jgi:hypothetical protein